MLTVSHHGISADKLAHGLQNRAIADNLSMALLAGVMIQSVKTPWRGAELGLAVSVKRPPRQDERHPDQQRSCKETLMQNQALAGVIKPNRVSALIQRGALRCTESAS